jgi:hypothetical protein
MSNQFCNEPSQAWIPRTPSQISEGWPVVCLNPIKTRFSLSRSESASRRFMLLLLLLLLLKLNPGMEVPQQLLSQHGNKPVQQALHQTATEFSANVKSKCHYEL